MLSLTMLGCVANIDNNHSAIDPETAQSDVKQIGGAWLEDLWAKVRENFDPSGIEKGHNVKLDVTLDEHGYAEKINITHSTGNRQLENASIAAIKDAEPFKYPDVSEEDKELFKRLIFKFKS